jgi:ribosomal-protein-alanine N-acetyltransferase
MNLRIVELTEAYARQVCNEWIYDGEYAVYNVTWEEAVQQDWAITNAEKRDLQFRGVMDDDDTLVGFFRMAENCENRIEIGLGMRPEQCGQGLGKGFVQFIMDYVRERFPAYQLYLEVRPFNKRAIACYEAAGFELKCQHEKVTPSGIIESLRMEYHR